MSLYFANAKDRAAPTIYKKKGNTRSVGVQPLHAACFKGGKIDPHEPGLFTKIIPATVMPLSTSSAMYLLLLACIILKWLGITRKNSLFIIFVKIMEIFFISHTEGDKVTLSQEESKHCVKVLRHKVGDSITLADGAGFYYSGVISVASPQGVLVDIVERNPATEIKYNLRMVVAPTKSSERYEWFLEKAVEIGVSRLSPVICEHSERRVLKRDRGERIVISAFKQSLKGFLPQLDELSSFADVVGDYSMGDGIVKLIAYCGDIDKESLMEALAKLPLGGDVVIMIGPEGDFSEEEISLAKEAGFIPVHIGESRLRAETAAVAAVAAVYLRSL